MCLKRLTGNAEASSAKTHSNARTMYALTRYGMRAPHERNFDHLSWLEMPVATRKQEVIKLKDRGGGNPPVAVELESGGMEVGALGCGGASRRF